jgi:hypothetical protein
MVYLELFIFIFAFALGLPSVGKKLKIYMDFLYQKKKNLVGPGKNSFSVYLARLF